jgi:hypothetical protein
VPGRAPVSGDLPLLGLLGFLLVAMVRIRRRG